MRSLGRDRFLNRYWWFDGSIGAYIPPEAHFYDTKGRPRIAKSRNPLDWASGYLFVEEFGMEKSVGSWEEEHLDDCKSGNQSGKWGFYSEPIHVGFKFSTTDCISWTNCKIGLTIGEYEKEISR